MTMNLDDYVNSLGSSLDDIYNNMGTHDAKDAAAEFVFCPECGTRTSSESLFCPNCGQSLCEDSDEENFDEAERADYNKEMGIVWTDTARLAAKYGVSQSTVLQVINEFVSNIADEQKWVLFDVAHLCLQNAPWVMYAQVLSDFINNNSIQAGPELPVFIIGGNDVIPQPCEPNPSAECDAPSEKYVYADFCYCFPQHVSWDFLDYRKALCNIGRLPLETGQMETDIYSDLQAYFNLSNGVTSEGGITIKRATMTTNVDWIPASREMVRNLPLYKMNDEKDFVLDLMYLSPNVGPEMSEDMAHEYYQSLKNSDMLIFNLHGADKPEYSGFYSTEEAFTIDTLQQIGARIFNTVACFGGRYIKFKRSQSMLLSAIYDAGVLLYAGACVPALGKCGNFKADENWRIRPAAYSESFMARFSEYECVGKMNAGLAFLKAKCDYYNSSRIIEEDTGIKATVLMFNLYGNPMLKFRTKGLQELQPFDGTIKSIPFKSTNRRVVFSNTKSLMSSKQSLLDEVRCAVDANLQSIHQTVVEKLYNQLGVEPRELSTVEAFEMCEGNKCVEKGYFYNYNRQLGAISTRIQVKVGSNGELLDAIQTK